MCYWKLDLIISGRNSPALQAGNPFEDFRLISCSSGCCFRTSDRRASELNKGLKWFMLFGLKWKFVYMSLYIRMPIDYRLIWIRGTFSVLQRRTSRMSFPLSWNFVASRWHSKRCTYRQRLLLWWWITVPSLTWRCWIPRSSSNHAVLIPICLTLAWVRIFTWCICIRFLARVHGRSYLSDGPCRSPLVLFRTSRRYLYCIVQLLRRLMRKKLRAFEYGAYNRPDQSLCSII